VANFDLSAVQAQGLDETASKLGRHYATVFIDMERCDKPVLFVTPGHSKETRKAFQAFLENHQGHPEVAGDLSGPSSAGWPNSCQMHR